MHRLACLLGCAAIAAAAGAKFSAAGSSLERLKKMSVEVSVERTGGLAASEVRGAVESRLRQAGIQIDPKSRHTFHVTVAVFEVPAEPGGLTAFAYSIHVAFNQQVYLARNPNIMTQAATWEAMSMRVASADRLRSTCTEDVVRRVEEFLDVYRSVNAGQ